MRTMTLFARSLTCLVLLVLSLGWGSPVRAQDVLPVPPLNARVTDQTHTLTPQQQAALEAKLAGFEAEAGSQIAVLLVPTTRPEDIASYAQRIADAWKIGRHDVGDGLLIVVALQDRAVRIEVSKALEGAVPDLAAKQIIDRAITPAFKRGDIVGGLNAGADALFNRIRAEHLPAGAGSQASRRSVHEADDTWQNLGLFLFLGVPVVGAVLTAVFGRKLGALLSGGAMGGLAWLVSSSLLVATGAGLIALVLIGVIGVGSRRPGLFTPGYGGYGGGYGGGLGGGGGWSSGGGSDGGFSSGGGGDFGGGGASGNW